MRCCACGRRLIVPGLAIGGGRMLGPTCAEKPENLPAEIRRELSATAPKKRQPGIRKKRGTNVIPRVPKKSTDSNQIDLFSG